MTKNLLQKISLSAFLCLLSVLSIAQQWNGLTLIAVKGAYSVGVCDTNGVMVKTWTFTPAQGSNSYPSYMTQGGFIWRTITTTSSVTPQNGGMTGRIQKMDYAGNILWDWTFNSPQGVLHHDICIMPNGNVLATAYDVRFSVDIVAAGCTNTATSMWSERIMEVQPVGTNSANIVWEWKLWDHLVQNVNPLKNNYYASIVNHPELLNINNGIQTDFFHMNGLDYYPILDQIAFSSHFKAEMYIIDHSTNTAGAATHTAGNSGQGGDLLYRWGKPSIYGAAGPTMVPSYVHDGHFIPDGVPFAGQLCGFNNSGQAVPFRSTVDRVNPPRAGYNYTIALGSAFTPTNFTSRYVCNAYSSGYSSAEQFPNGNQMMSMAPAGNVYEVDAAGTFLWSKNTGGLTPQAHRYTPCFITFTAPAQPTISVLGNTLSCTSAVTYQWYFNGTAIPTGTLQSYVPTASGVYLVRITDINGCAFYYSNPNYFIYVATGISNLSKELNRIEVYPNPSDGQININLNGITGNYEIEVSSSNGQLLFTKKNNSQIDLSGFSNGVYFIKVNTEKGVVTKKIVLLK